MKRLFSIIVILLASSTMAVAADLTVQWDYDVTEAVYVDAWRLECGPVSGQYDQMWDIPKEADQVTYTLAMPRADFQGAIYCAMKAISDERGESGYSNEAVVPMMRPFNLKIILE